MTIDAAAFGGGSDGFDGPLDRTECPDDCETRDKYGHPTFAHLHCAVDGCVLPAEGGGGDDGLAIGGHSNLALCSRPDCGVPIHEKCARFADDPKAPLCLDCYREALSRAQEERPLLADVIHATEDLADSRARFEKTRDPADAVELRVRLAKLRAVLDGYDRSVTLAFAEEAA